MPRSTAVRTALFLTALFAASAAVSSQSTRAETTHPRDIEAPGTIKISVDATEVERGIFQVEETMPVTHAGPITLLFPKWIPGNHAPAARIEGLAGLTIIANGRRLAWARDAENMHAFRVEIPRQVSQITLRFQYLSPTSTGQGRIVTTPAMLNLQWFSVTAYPAGYYARQIRFEPTVRLPEGWRYTSQLEPTKEAGGATTFRPVDLEVLLDSPIFAGLHFRRFRLGHLSAAPISLDVVADRPELLRPAPRAIEEHARLVRQAGLLFGRPPFRSYRFMLALTSELGGIGTEHLGSSENTRPVDYLSDWRGGALLPHEFAHVWNGKARRPADLWSADFNQPMHNSMLWLYEGQTQFWGFVLAARSGLMTREQVLDVFARLAALYQSQPGRAWRPLADTGNDAIITRYLVDEPWPSWRRSLADSYSEADLMWLEADGVIRELSGEKYGLDEFARTFFSGGGERPSLYSRADVIAGLNRVQAFDWEAFLDQRLHQVRPAAPSDWLRRSGYRLAFADTPTQAFVDHEARAHRIDLRQSIGLMLRAGPQGAVDEVVWDSPSFAAGLTPGASIRAVNAGPYSPERLKAAIQANMGGSTPIRLTVRNRNRERVIILDYRGGLRYPRLERVAGTINRLDALLTPRK